MGARDRHNRDFHAIFVELQRRIAQVKIRTAAIVADSHAVMEEVQRCRARRTGTEWTPEPAPKFVVDRSNSVH